MSVQRVTGAGLCSLSSLDWEHELDMESAWHGNRRGMCWPAAPKPQSFASLWAPAGVRGGCKKRLEKGEKRMKKKSSKMNISKGAGVLGVEARGEDSWTYQGRKSFGGGKREHNEVRDEVNILYLAAMLASSCERVRKGVPEQLAAAASS